MKTLILYGTSGCHLCDEASHLLAYMLDESQYHIETIDISVSDELLERYGVKIPVLQRIDSHAELHWPFDESAVEVFLLNTP